MTQDEIIKMAHQTSKEWAKEYPTPEETAHPVPERFLEIFAKLVAEKEREECAKICETLVLPMSGKVRQPLAKAMRARRET